MNSITRHTRYCPHLIDTRYNAVKLFRKWKDAKAVCRRYHISRASLYRWNKRYDGTKKSLMDKSHRPNSAHPNAHAEEEIKWIKNVLCSFRFGVNVFEIKRYQVHQLSEFFVLNKEIKNSGIDLICIKFICRFLRKSQHLRS